MNEQVAKFDIRITFLVKLKRKHQISGKDVIKYAVHKKSRVFFSLLRLPFTDVLIAVVILAAVELDKMKNKRS